MSRDYKLHCDDCDEDSADNFRENALREIVRLWPHIAAIIDSIENWAGFKFEIMNDYDEPTLDWFMKQHYEHKLTLMDEYDNVVEVAKYATGT